MHNRLLVIVLVAGLLLVGHASVTRADTPDLTWAAGPADTWRASPVADDCLGPVDTAGRAWYDAKFDDSAWTPTTLPEAGTIPSDQDRYYRLHYRLGSVSAVEITLTGDDGLQLYVNGRRIGGWGAAECHGEEMAGEVHLDLTAYMHTGDNVLAVHVSNGPGDSYLAAELSQRSLTTSKITPFLDLPYDYIGSSFARESSSAAQGGRVTAYFDHQSPGSCGGRGCSPSDTRTLHFFGYEGGISAADGSSYKVFYNGHSGTDYALPAGRAVLAAAAGVVTYAGEIASVCSDGQTRSARVVRILHDNGYTTEYWHLASFGPGIDVGSRVSRDRSQPIGTIGETGCTTGPHLHFAVYTPSRLAVDPYAWDPRPDTSWYGRTDPANRWSSHYLWVHQLTTTGAASASAPSMVYSPTASARVMLPPLAEELRLELAEGLPQVHIPNHSSLYLFSAAGYGADGKPALLLDADAYIDIRLSGSQLQVVSNSLGAPGILRWDPDTGRWQDLPTTWDPASRVASAPSRQLGTFAVALHSYTYYLPALSKQSPQTPANSPDSVLEGR